MRNDKTKKGAQRKRYKKGSQSRKKPIKPVVSADC